MLLNENPHYRIGALEVDLRVEKARAERLEAEVNRLRAAMLARLTILERLPATATTAELTHAIEATIDRLGEALYPTSTSGDDPVPCPCGDGSCVLCDDNGMVAS